MTKEKYTYDEVYQRSLKYFKGDELAASVFAGKYALQDAKGNFLELTPDDMHSRLASEFAGIEEEYDNSKTYTACLKTLNISYPKDLQ